MPYNADLDQCLFSKQWESEAGRIVVGIYSYNQGTKKLQITREAKTADGEFRFVRLGRMSKAEMEGILPLIQEGMKHMD